MLKKQESKTKIKKKYQSFKTDSELIKMPELEDMDTKSY